MTQVMNILMEMIAETLQIMKKINLDLDLLPREKLTTRLMLVEIDLVDLGGAGVGVALEDIGLVVELMNHCGIGKCYQIKLTN